MSTKLPLHAEESMPKTEDLPPNVRAALRHLGEGGHGHDRTGGEALRQRGLALVIPANREGLAESYYVLTDAGWAIYDEILAAENAAILAARAAQGEVVVPAWAVHYVLRWYSHPPSQCGEIAEAFADLQACVDAMAKEGP